MLNDEAAWEDEQGESLSQALSNERQDILELELAQDEAPPQLEQGPRKKKLKRELRREALTRLEDAARTVDDFTEVTEFWDKLEQNEVRRVSNHETTRGDIPLEWGMAEGGPSFPDPISIFTKQAQKGDFIETIFNCPYELHELVEGPDISELLWKLKPERKEILYYAAVRGYSSSKIAAIREQTDRNIRKVREATLGKLRKRLFERLRERDGHSVPITNSERTFLDT